MDANRPAESHTPPPDATPDQSAPWQEIESGRYQPRRIRGSCLGRELG